MCWRRSFLYYGLPSRLLVVPAGGEGASIFYVRGWGWPVHADARAAESHECYVILSGDGDGGLGNLVGRACLIYVDDTKVIGRSVEGLIVNLRAVLLRCMERGLFLVAHKLVLFAKGVK